MASDTPATATWADFDIDLFVRTIRDRYLKAMAGIDFRLSGTAGDRALDALMRVVTVDGLKDGKTMLDECNVLFRSILARDGSEPMEALLSVFFHGKMPPPHAIGDEASDAVARQDRWNRFSLGMLPLFRLTYAGLRALVIAGSVALQKGQREPNLLRNVAGALRQIHYIQLSSIAVSRRIPHDHVFIEAVSVLAERSLRVLSGGAGALTANWKAILVDSGKVLSSIASYGISHSRTALVAAFPDARNRGTRSTQSKIMRSVLDIVKRVAHSPNGLLSDRETLASLPKLLGYAFRVLESDKEFVLGSEDWSDMETKIREARRSDRLTQRAHGDDPDSCDGCLALQQEGIELKRCSRCLVGRFCSVACMKSAWSKHKEYCFNGSLAPDWK